MITSCNRKYNILCLDSKSNSYYTSGGYETGCVNMADSTFQVVWPLGKRVSETLPLARRIPDLSQITVCELWDWIFRGEEIFPALRELLSERYPGIRFVDYTAFGNTRGPKERELVANLPRALREHSCGAVISGVGA